MSDQSKQYKVLQGIDGIPFRMPAGMAVPMLRESDNETKQPKVVHEAHAKVFDLAKPEDIAEYAAVWDTIVSGKAMLGKEDIRWDEVRRCHVVLMRWMNLFLEMPEKGLTHEELVENGGRSSVR